VAGFRLVPDTALYSSGAVFEFPVLLGGVPGAVAGFAGVAVVSAAAAGAAVALVSGSAVIRWWMLLLSAYWFAFPGVDAVGVALVLAAVALARRSRHVLSPGFASWAVLWVAFLAHPVAAFVGWPLVGRRWWALGACAVFTFLAIVVVGTADGITSTDRYAAVLLAGVLVRVSDGRSERPTTAPREVVGI